MSQDRSFCHFVVRQLDEDLEAHALILAVFPRFVKSLHGSLSKLVGIYFSEKSTLENELLSLGDSIAVLMYEINNLEKRCFF